MAQFDEGPLFRRAFRFLLRIGRPEEILSQYAVV
jgi:hypothetical protein